MTTLRVEVGDTFVHMGASLYGVVSCVTAAGFKVAWRSGITGRTWVSHYNHQDSSHLSTSFTYNGDEEFL